MTLPEVLKSRPEMRAAELNFDGLAVFCFNSSKKLWEVAYPRKLRHTLRLKIEALDAADSPISPPLFDKEVDRNVRSFNISLTNGSVGHYKEFPRGGPRAKDFKRKSSGNDPHDLGWMIDLAGNELNHGNFLGLRRSGRPISLARIQHSLFCNLKPDDEAVKIAPRDADDPDAGTELGRTNTEIVGVLLANGPGEIRFESDPAGLIKIGPLQYDLQKRYRIEIINEDEQQQVPKKDFVRGDLRLYYDDVIEVAGEPQDLWAKPVTSAEFVPADGDCHGTEFSGPTLEGLITP